MSDTTPEPPSADEPVPPPVPVDPEALQRVHRAAGLDRLGRVHRLLGDAALLSRSTHKEVRAAFELAYCSSVAEGLQGLVAAHPPLGLIVPGPAGGPAQALGEAGIAQWRQTLAQRGWRPAILALTTLTQSVLSALVEELLRRLQAERAQELEAWGERVRHCNEPQEGLSIDPGAAFAQALKEGLRFTWRLIEVLPRVVERDAPDPAARPAFGPVARASIELVEMLASTHRQVFGAIQQTLLDPDLPAQQAFFRARFFRLVQGEDGARLALLDDALPTEPPAHRDSPVRTGCPASLAACHDGHSALEIVHSWVCDVADALLFEESPGD